MGEIFAATVCGLGWTAVFGVFKAAVHWLVRTGSYWRDSSWQN